MILFNNSWSILSKCVLNNVGFYSFALLIHTAMGIYLCFDILFREIDDK